jgi:hypothetical protein
MAGERNVVRQAIAVAQTAAVLARVFAVVAFSVALFAAAYLDYFILPFTFVLVALSIVGMSHLVRQWAKFRDRRRNDV